MNTHRCCGHAPDAEDLRRSPSPLRRLRRAVEWLVPSAILVLMPKCPMCVAAYIAMFTGVGISLSAAAHVRTLVLTVCLATLALLAYVLLRSLARQRMVERIDYGH